MLLSGCTRGSGWSLRLVTVTLMTKAGTRRWLDRLDERPIVSCARRALLWRRQADPCSLSPGDFAARFLRSAQVAKASIDAPKASDTRPHHRLMLMPSER